MLALFDLGLVFVHVPKCGGVTVRTHLKANSTSHLELWGESWGGRVLAPGGDVAHVPARNLGRVLSPTWLSTATTFAVIREPVDRLASAWRWLVDRESAPRDFEEFVLNVSDIDIPHTRPQVDYVCDEDGRVLVDRLLRFEDLDREFSALCSEFGLPPCSLRENTSTPREATISAWAMHHVREVYSADFELLTRTTSTTAGLSPVTSTEMRTSHPSLRG